MATSPVVENLTQFKKINPLTQPVRPLPDKLLMVAPEFYRVEYAINPFMKTATGELQKVDTALSQEQWRRLKGAYEQIAYMVTVLPGHPELPDMVFAANQAFPFWNMKSQKPAVVLGQMTHDSRKPEVALFAKWFSDNGYEVHRATTPELKFEGNGDALLHPTGQFIWGGYGERTDKAFYQELARITDLPVVALKLKRKEFYHLDTCFALIDARTVVIEPSSFSPESIEVIESVFSNVIEIERAENMKHLLCNCHSPDGSTVIVQKGSLSFGPALSKLGYRTKEVDLSEFRKAGGSAFCLKMMVF